MSAGVSLLIKLLESAIFAMDEVDEDYTCYTDNWQCS